MSGSRSYSFGYAKTSHWVNRIGYHPKNTDLAAVCNLYDYQSMHSFSEAMQTLLSCYYTELFLQDNPEQMEVLKRYIGNNASQLSQFRNLNFPAVLEGLSARTSEAEFKAPENPLKAALTNQPVAFLAASSPERRIDVFNAFRNKPNDHQARMQLVLYLIENLPAYFRAVYHVEPVSIVNVTHALSLSKEVEDILSLIKIGDPLYNLIYNGILNEGNDELLLNQNIGKCFDSFTTFIKLQPPAKSKDYRISSDVFEQLKTKETTTYEGFCVTVNEFEQFLTYTKEIESYIEVASLNSLYDNKLAEVEQAVKSKINAQSSRIEEKEAKSRVVEEILVQRMRDGESIFHSQLSYEKEKIKQVFKLKHAQYMDYFKQFFAIYNPEKIIELNDGLRTSCSVPPIQYQMDRTSFNIFNVQLKKAQELLKHSSLDKVAAAELKEEKKSEEQEEFYPYPGKFKDAVQPILALVGDRRNGNPNAQKRVTPDIKNAIEKMLQKSAVVMLTPGESLKREKYIARNKMLLLEKAFAEIMKNKKLYFTRANNKYAFSLFFTPRRDSVSGTEQKQIKILKQLYLEALKQFIANRTYEDIEIDMNVNHHNFRDSKLLAYNRSYYEEFSKETTASTQEAFDICSRSKVAC